MKAVQSLLLPEVISQDLLLCMRCVMRIGRLKCSVTLFLFHSVLLRFDKTVANLATRLLTLAFKDNLIVVMEHMHDVINDVKCHEVTNVKSTNFQPSKVSYLPVTSSTHSYIYSPWINLKHITASSRRIWQAKFTERLMFAYDKLCRKLVT